MGLFILLWWLATIIALFWVYSDASEKKGSNIGCLWTLVVFILGPIGFIAYLLVRNMD